MTVEAMRKRAEVIRAMRAFFVDLGYLEVDTPLLSPGLIPESMIEPFATRFSHPRRGDRELFLVPSPEIWMKRLLASGSGSLFQIGHCFRNAEQIGRTHNPEFTMLEWYSTGHDYMDSADRTDALLEFLTKGDSRKSIRPPCRRMSMAEAFREIAGIELAACDDIDVLREETERAGLATGGLEDWEQLFNALFLQCVEPELPRERPLVLFDYPSRIPTLAKRIPDSPWSERWELYIEGIEIANCFTEETDPNRVAEFYRNEPARIGTTAGVRRIDASFPEIFGNGFPGCSGVALGVDRLLICLLGVKDIRGVIFFPVFDIFD